MPSVTGSLEDRKQNLAEIDKYFREKGLDEEALKTKAFAQRQLINIQDIIYPAEQFRHITFQEKKILLDPWLREQQIVWVSGWRGVGKTFFALSLVHCITTGEQFGPWQIGEPVPCLYLDGEMVGPDIQERLNGLDTQGMDVIERKAPLYIYSDAFASTFGVSQAHLGNKKWRDQVKKILLDKDIRLWVIDNLTSLSKGIDENSKKEFDPINAFLLDLRFQGITTMILHHTGKAGDQRGTSAHEDNADICITLKQPHDYSSEDGARFLVHFKKARIPLEDAAKTHNIEFKLTKQDEALVWTWQNVKREIRVEAIKLIDEGLSASDIANVLGTSQGNVRVIKARAIKDGQLSKTGKLSPTGMDFIHENL